MHSLQVLGSQTGIPKGLKKIGNSGGEVLTIFEFRGMGGRAFWNSRRQGGLKFSCCPWEGMDIFWNHPMENQAISLKMKARAGLHLSNEVWNN